MAAYVASGRVGHVAPRVAVRGGERALDLHLAEARLTSATDRVVLAEADGRPIERELTAVERWDAIRERWSQLTFYLFSPESWR